MDLRKSETRRYLRVRQFFAAFAAIAITTALLAGCDSSAGSSAGAPGGGSGNADVTAAKAAVAKYTGKPSPFPVTVPLKHAVPADAKFVYLQASDPIGALLGSLLEPAVRAAGGQFVAIPAGQTASSVQAAASSAIAMKPAVVLLPAFIPSQFGGKLKALREGGAQIVGAGMIGAKQYGIQFCDGCEEMNALDGRVMADWVVATKGANANAVFYTVPQLSFTPTMWTAFKDEMAKLCPGCTARNVPIDVATFGTTAPRTIVNDLQAHDGSNVAVFSTMDMAQGLPGAMSAAGLDVSTIGGAPTPENLQDIKAGKLTAGVAIDLPTYAWTMVDAGARLMQGQEPEAGEIYSPIQILERSDITFDPSRGFSGYPDYVQRFTALWHP